MPGSWICSIIVGPVFVSQNSYVFLVVLSVCVSPLFPVCVSTSPVIVYCAMKSLFFFDLISLPWHAYRFTLAPDSIYNLIESFTIWYEFIIYISGWNS